jgi:thioredoxin 1
MSDFNTIINSDKPTLVDFFATWCGPCKTMAPIVDETKNILGDKAKVLKVNVDNNREVSMKYNIRSIPTMVIFKNGEIVWRKPGVTSSKDLVEEVNKFL